MANQFSPKVSQILSFSKEEAERLSSTQVGPEHLLLGLLRDKSGTLQAFFNHHGANIDTIKHELENRVRQEHASPFVTTELLMSEQANNILRLAVLEARIQHTETVDIEHLLLAILHDSTNNGVREILEENNISYQEATSFFHKQTNQVHNGIGLPEEDEEENIDNHATSSSNGTQTSTKNQKHTKEQSKTPVLDNFSTDLTKAAAEGKLDMVVGREKEIMRVSEILGRRKKNNPILIGEPGVGKSAIVEGLAQLIVKHHTSPVLFGKRVVNLDMTGVVAGTKYRGQFEERIKALIKELEQNPDIIVFIDEIHTIIGAGSTPGSMDAANILKPALARGTIQCIGATTLDEYRNSIEKDGALETFPEGVGGTDNR